VVLSLCLLSLNADIIGKWKTIDDVTKNPKSIVEITKTNGIYSGRIEKIFAGDICTNCQGKYKNKSLQGIEIISGLKQNDDMEYSGGKITDPKTDKTYKLSIKDNGTTMTLLGYIGWGIASVGRTQIWYKIK